MLQPVVSHVVFLFLITVRVDPQIFSLILGVRPCFHVFIRFFSTRSENPMITTYEPRSDDALEDAFTLFLLFY